LEYLMQHSPDGSTILLLPENDKMLNVMQVSQFQEP